MEMTCLEKLKQDHPEWSELEIRNVVNNDCPTSYCDIGQPRSKNGQTNCHNYPCEECWDREIPGTEPSPKEHSRNAIKVMLDPGAKMPTRAHDTDAGYDLYSMEDIMILERGNYTFDTGVHVEIPSGYVGFIKSKSGLNVNYNITSEGVIDSGYTGSIRVKLYNNGDKAVRIRKEQKISQLVLLPIITPDLELVDSLEDTERGEGGFGSSGKF